MVLSNEDDDDIFKKFNDLCNDLNMDREAADEAWQTFDGIRQNCTLEGEKLHWLGCALYVACRNTAIPTVGGKAGTLVEGNLVSLTRLLRLCNLSLIQFISKIKKWADMANLPLEFRDKIGRLERNFAVSMVIFKKFQPIFHDMFVITSNTDNIKNTKTKKQRNIPCSPQRVFDFAWTLFICIKADFPDISDDLVNSYHLLLACCDLIFSNAILADRRDIVNPSFPGLPKGYGEKDYVAPLEPPCIIYHLCKNHDGIIVEAKGIKEYCFKNHMKKMFDRRILRGDSSNFSGLTDICNFEANVRSINKSYEEYVLSVGDFDERIFLDESQEHQEENPDRPVPRTSKNSPNRPVLRTHNFRGDEANTDIGTPTKIIGQSGIGEFTEKIQAKRNLNHQVGGLTQLAPPTPLTGRKYLKSKEPSNITPVSTATQSVSRLQSMLSGRKTAPSSTLQEIINSCEKNPRIEELVKELGEQFCLRYTQAADTHPGVQIDFAKKRLQLAECLFYKFLEDILIDEKKKPAFDYNTLLHQEIFHQTLFACCLEIVIYSYNSQRTFPWVLEALNIAPYHFYKVIEIIIRNEDQLSRDMVKHLNMIEENILETLAWKDDSPLWTALDASGLPVPSCEDVSLPGQLSTAPEEDNSQNKEGCPPIANPAIRRIIMPGMQQSPTPTASERFQQSPIPCGFAKKRLFVEPGKGVLRTVKPGQSLLNTSQLTAGQTKTISAVTLPTIEAEDGKRYIPITISPSSGSVIIQTTSQNPAVTNPAQPSSQNLTSVSTAAITAAVGQTAAVAQSAAVPQTAANTTTERLTAKRTGSLALFFRKFYHLASVRMQELCTQLELMDTELRRKIWTCFEHSIVEHTDLMLDRHLDQILMCAVYVICKIVGPEKPFTEVMRCYRLQPQSSSNVYRSVLLKSKSRGERVPVSPVVNEVVVESQELIRSSSTIPGNISTGVVPVEVEDRCDIIKFYNTVYVQKLQNFARKFTGRCPQNENITLSPLFVNQTSTKSPRKRVSDKHPVYIRVLASADPKVFPPSPTKPLSYCFSRSPAKDLMAINRMIQIGSYFKGVGKRLLNDDDKEGDAESGVSPPKQAAGFVTRKVQDLFVDRLVAKSQD